MHKEAIKVREAVCFARTTAILISILAIHAATLAAAEVTISATYHCNGGKVEQSTFLQDMNYEWNAIIHQEVLAGGSTGLPSDCRMGRAKERLELIAGDGSAATSIDIKGWRKENTKEDMGYSTGFAAGTSNELVVKWGLQNSGQSTVECTDSKGVTVVDNLIQLNKMAYIGSVTADPSEFSMHATAQKSDQDDIDTGIIHSAKIFGGNNFGQVDSIAVCTKEDPDIPTQAIFLLHSDATSRRDSKTELSVEVPVVAGDRITTVNMVSSSSITGTQEKELEVDYFDIRSIDSMDGMGTAIEAGVSFVPKMTFRI